MKQHIPKESRLDKQDKHEIRDLLLSLISNHDDIRNLLHMTDSRPVGEVMGSIQTVSINPIGGERKAHSSRNYSSQ